MKSIPTIFIWDKETRMVTDKPLRMVDWVFVGKGVATRKYDGVAIKVEHDKVYRRLEWKPGDPVPVGFVRSQPPDPKRPLAAIPGWVPVNDHFLTKPIGPDERALKEAWNAYLANAKQRDVVKAVTGLALNPYAPEPKPVTYYVPDGTYELCGPNIRRNSENFKSHVLLRHGADIVKGVPRTFEKLKTFLETYEGEGIVWHYQTGAILQTAKIKRRDFGFNTRVSKADVAMAYRAPEVKVEEAVSV